MTVSSKQGHWHVGTPLFSPPPEALKFPHDTSASGLTGGLADRPASAAASGSGAAALHYERGMLPEAAFKTSVFAVNTIQLATLASLTEDPKSKPSSTTKTDEEFHFSPAFSFSMSEATEGNRTNAAQTSAANSGWVLAPQFFPTPPANVRQQVPASPHRAQTGSGSATFQSHSQAPTEQRSTSAPNATQGSSAAGAGAGRPLVATQQRAYRGEEQARQSSLPAAAASQPFTTVSGASAFQSPSGASSATLPSQPLGMLLTQLQEIERAFNVAATCRSAVRLSFGPTSVQTQDWLFQTLAEGLHAELNALAAKIISLPPRLNVTPALQVANKDREQAKRFFAKNLRGIYEQAIVRGISKNLTILYSNYLILGAEKAAEAFYERAKSGKGAFVDVMSEEPFHHTYCFFLSDPEVIKMAFPVGLDGIAPLIDLLAYITKWSDQLKRPLPLPLQVLLSITPSSTEL